MNYSIKLMQQFSVFRKAGQKHLDTILSQYHTTVPRPDGSVLRIPVFVPSKKSNENSSYNWNKNHPYYENWRGMVARGLDKTSPDYACVRVDPAFMGLRNNAADIHHYDKYGFFSYVRAIDYFLGHTPHKPGFIIHHTKYLHRIWLECGHLHISNGPINPRYHYCIENMRWLPDSDNAHAKYSASQ
jgi:hypothetical protein